MRATGALAVLDAIAFNAAVAAITAPPYAIVAGDVGLVMMQVVTFSNSLMRHYVKRIKVGANVAMVGHTPGASVPVGFGIRADVLAEPATNTQLHGIAEGNQSLGANDAAVLATVENWFDAVKAAGHLVECPGVATGFMRYVDATGAFVGVGDALTIVGAPVLTTITSPNWSW